MGGRLNYFRAGVSLSLPRLGRIVRMVVVGMGLAATAACAQYPGLVKKTDTSTPVLRSIAVLEWTGAAGKPTASRLVPVMVYDGEQLNDGTIYLTRPEPLALAGGTEYELQMDGKPSGLFDVFGAGEMHGAWLGFGAWKPLSAAAATQAANSFNTSSLLHPIDGGDDDKPVLKRKHPKEADADDGKASGSGSPAASTAPASGSGGSTTAASKSQDVDPDRPQLKRKASDDSASSTTSGSGTGSSNTTASSSGGTQSSDPDRPQLKRKSGDDSGSGSGTTSSTTSPSTTASSGGGTQSVDPDRPTIRRKHNVTAEGEMETSNAAPDPDRPRLKRGKPADLASAEESHLVGEPPTMQQAVAVSDASNRAQHPWKYSWANPEDETKMKVALEAMARTALGMDAPPAPPAKKTTGTTAAARAAAAKKKTSMLPAEPPALADEQFRVFELTYGATATMVLTASTPKPPLPDEAVPASDKAAPAPDETPVIKRGKPTTSQTASQTTSQTGSSTTAKRAAPAPVPAKPAPQKFVTLVAQPDLYGGVLVLYKSVTDSAHLDETPRMRLVDAVDALGDNRGELLFELRGATQRQFALFRVLRGSAEQLFATVALP